MLQAAKVVDKQEAGEILARRIAELRRLRYAELLQFLDKPQATDVVHSSGRRYQMETEVFWDDRPGENLRINVAIDDGGWRAFFPLISAFIKSPDDQFVGE